MLRRDPNGGSAATITALTAKERADELARMLGGRDLTSVTLKHATELLQKAGKRKKLSLPA